MTLLLMHASSLLVPATDAQQHICMSTRWLRGPGVHRHSCKVRLPTCLPLQVHAPQEEEKVLGGDFAGGSTTKVAEAVSTPVEEQPKEGQQVVQRRRLMSAAHSWPAVSVWVLLLAGIGWYLPRFIRRRRARSGLRSD